MTYNVSSGTLSLYTTTTTTGFYGSKDPTNNVRALKEGS